jgi:hypothetical protein
MATAMPDNINDGGWNKWKGDQTHRRMKDKHWIGPRDSDLKSRIDAAYTHFSRE